MFGGYGLRRRGCLGMRMRTTLCLAAVALAGPSALGTVILETDFDELCAQADVVMVGTVTGVESLRPPGRSHICTWTTFRIDEWIDGADDRASITVRTLGGTAGGETLRVHGMPRFEVGRQYVLFLRQPDRSICPVVGWTQGCFCVERSAEDGDALVRTYDNRGVSRVVQGKIVTESDTSSVARRDKHLTLDAFVAEIKTARIRAPERRKAKTRR